MRARPQPPTQGVDGAAGDVDSVTHALSSSPSTSSFVFPFAVSPAREANLTVNQLAKPWKGIKSDDDDDDDDDVDVVDVGGCEEWHWNANGVTTPAFDCASLTVCKSIVHTLTGGDNNSDGDRL
jgi:hypothetical protein